MANGVTLYPPLRGGREGAVNCYIMTLLSIDWSDRFLLAGIGVGMVLCILVAIVLVLQIFTFIAMKTTRKASEVKTNYKETKQAKSFDKASDEEKAAVAVALYLYYYEKNNRENRILTIKPQPSAWHYELNERL